MRAFPKRLFLALPFNDKVPQGTVVFHEGLSATDFS
jgi:hypothetical protein